MYTHLTIDGHYALLFIMVVVVKHMILRKAMNYCLPDRILRQIAKQIFIAVLLLCGLSTSAQDGSLDTTFNSTGPQPGVASTSVGSGNANNNAVAIQADGNIITAGTANDSFALARFTITGALDTSFGVDGIVITPIDTTTSFINALAIQPDTAIVAAGAIISLEDVGSFALARYLSDGSLDASFGTGGIVTTSVGSSPSTAIYAVALQVDGKIVAIGTDNSNFVLARYLVNGSLDASFGAGGIVTTPIGISTSSGAFGGAIQVDNAIVAVGTDGTNFALVRYLPDGSLDTSFGTGGVVVTPIGTESFALAGVIQADGKIVAAGETFSDDTESLALARYLPNGSLDASFGVGGIVTTAGPDNQALAASAVTIQSDGKIIAAGNFSGTSSPTQFALVRYLPDGSLDTSFGTGGIVLTFVGDASAFIMGTALQQDGKIIAVGAAGFGGFAEFAVARYLVDPVLFPTVITSVTPTGPLKTIQLSGTAQNESIVTIILDGVATNFAITTPLDSSADETNTTGTWSINIGTLTPGLHTIVASASYKTGNIIILSNPIQIRFRLSSPCGFITC